MTTPRVLVVEDEDAPCDAFVLCSVVGHVLAVCQVWALGPARNLAEMVQPPV